MVIANDASVAVNKAMVRLQIIRRETAAKYNYLLF